jgi:hypothetical protein
MSSKDTDGDFNCIPVSVSRLTLRKQHRIACVPSPWTDNLVLATGTGTGPAAVCPFRFQEDGIRIKNNARSVQLPPLERWRATGRCRLAGTEPPETESDARRADWDHGRTCELM